MNFNQGTLYLLIDYAACYMHYMDPDVRCLIKADKLNHSLAYTCRNGAYIQLS